MKRAQFAVAGVSPGVCCERMWNKPRHLVKSVTIQEGRNLIFFFC